MKQADQIREFANRNHIVPAKSRGLTTITLTAGEIRKAMGLPNNATPAVVSAIEARAFRELAIAKLVERSGPHQGSTVTWVFEI